MKKHQQYSRLQNIEIIGIPEIKDECAENIVVKIANHAGLQITKSDLEFAHRVQAKRPDKNRPRAIIVRLKNRQVKDSILSAARKCRSLSTSDIGYGGTPQKIFINEHLIQTTKNLLKMCKARGKELAYKFTWTKNCRIYMRKDETSPAVLITSVLDLEKL